MDTVTVIVGCHRCDTRGNCTFTTPKASENQAAACDLMMIMTYTVVGCSTRCSPELSIKQPSRLCGRNDPYLEKNLSV